MSKYKFKFSHRSDNRRTYYFITDRPVRGNCYMQIAVDVAYFWREVTE